MSEKADVPPQVETIPSRQHGISALASANAPFIYFETAPAFAFAGGIVRITLAASRDIPTPTPPECGHDWAVVAHLRMSVLAARALKATIDDALLLGATAAGGPPDASGAGPKPN